MTDISIHALREEGDNFLLRTWHKADDFYPRPPRGGRPSTASTFTLTAYFYPRPPRGGRQLPQWVTTMIMNFYPRPPRGGRPLQIRLDETADRFLSTPSARRATSYASASKSCEHDFYPRPPRGGRLRVDKDKLDAMQFLSTPSARRATDGDISHYAVIEFLSTPSARRATIDQQAEIDSYLISIHALREEGDPA